MSKVPPPEGYEDNPEWTDEDFARARPVSEVHPLHVVDALTKRGRGRPAGSDKQLVSLRIDKDVIESYRAAGPGWHSRINEDLRKASGL